MVTTIKQRFTFSELLKAEGEGLSIDTDFQEAYQAYSKDRYSRAIDLMDNAIDRINYLHSIAHAAKSRLIELRLQHIENNIDESEEEEY